MTTKPVTRVKKTYTAVPETIESANILLGKLGTTQDVINEIERGLKEKVAELKAEALKNLRPLMTLRDRQVNALFTFANPRKDELTADAKTVKLGMGKFGWRMTPPRVDTGLTDEELVLLLKRNDLVEYVRTKEEVDRQKLLVDQPLIVGVAYVQNDEFFVAPNQVAKKPKTFTKAIDRV
ncbi:MAG: host-nuclease inhibitor Gam family protein [Candidatus Moraniibacteriota bacterium]